MPAAGIAVQSMITITSSVPDQVEKTDDSNTAVTVGIYSPNFEGHIMMVRIAAIAAVLACTGCASVMNDTTHPMKVETKNAAGELVTGAECKLTNDYGTISVLSGETARVRRSNQDLDILCKDPKNPDAVARAISRVNGGMWGNILIGGGIGAIIDHSKGTGYTYPTWVQLIFGKTLVFDRSAETEGLPTVGTEAPASATKPNVVVTTAK